MNRAYSVLDIREMDEQGEFVHLRGIASTPTTDRVGDVVVSTGAQFKTPMPLLWQHDHRQPVGQVTFAKPTDKGIPFEARIPRVVEAGKLKDRVDEAIQSLKYNLVSAVSIGFRALEDGYEVMKNGGLKFTKWEWLELSLVTIPANSDAVIQAVKNIDQQRLAAFGSPDGADDQGDAPAPAIKQGKRVVSVKPFRRTK